MCDVTKTMKTSEEDNNNNSDNNNNEDTNNNENTNNNNNESSTNDNAAVELTSQILEAFTAIANRGAILEHTLDVRPISGVGENSYGSVFQVKIIPVRTLPSFVAVQPIYCVLKIAPKNTARRAHMKVPEYYTREVFMYEQVFQEFQTLHEELNNSRQHRIEELKFDVAPEMHHASLLNEDEFIIFEDLTHKDFTQNSRIKMPTYDLVVSALKALAQLHAMSFVLQVRKPQVFVKLVEQIHDNLFTPHMDTVSIEFGKKHVRRTRTMLEDEQKLIRNQQLHRHNAELIEVLHKIEEHFKSICLRCVEGAANAPYAVICHGDFWNNNILYKYDDNNTATLAKLIDFQMSRYAPPVLDVVHYLFACIEKDLRDLHFNEFLQIYYDTLAQSISVFELDPKVIYPEETFQQQLRDFGIYGFCMSAFAMPFFISNTNEIPDLDKVSQAIQDLSSASSSSLSSSSAENSDTEDNDGVRRDVVANVITKLYDNATKSNNLNVTATVNATAVTSNSSTDVEKCRELVEEYDMLTERTVPIFKRRMTGIVADLLKYDMIENVVKL